MKIKKPKRIWGNCKHCGSELYRKLAIFCSKGCYTEFQLSSHNPMNIRVQKECEHCLKEFTVMNYMKDRTRFCSISCSSKHQFKNSLGLTLIDKNCTVCDTLYRVPKYRIGSSYCSIKCKHNSGRKTCVCEVCNHIYNTTNWEDSGVCSHQCNNKRLKINPTTLELKVSNLLKNNCIEFDSQITIKADNKTYVVDFIVRDMIIIEAYGDYWHCNPTVYHSDYYHKQCKMYASEIWKRDSDRINALNELGYKTYIIWEFDSNDKIKTIINEICKD